MTFISYAQNFEDVMLWRALRHIQNGCYIDIGANDPIVDSVSLAFYEHGWRGVHLEPTAQYANLLRKQRPDELVIQAAVSDSQKLLTFFEFPDTGLSTLDATIAAEHQQKGFRVLQTVTPTLTLDDVFAQNLRTDIHWLKIDVEGFEEAVLRGWNTSEVRPWIVVVESTLPMSTTPSHQYWEALVLQKGYQFVYFDGLNRYYVSDLHPELMAEPWIPPNVFDGFTIDGRASNVVSQDIQRRLQAATQSGLQSAVAELQASEQAKQTLLNQLAEARGQLEQQAAMARKEHQTLNRQLKDARDELGQMVRLVSQREQEFSQRFTAFSAENQAVAGLFQKERDHAAAQLAELQQQLQTQQQQFLTEQQRFAELETRLAELQQQLRQKEQVFARQLLQLSHQKSGQEKVFQVREQSMKIELQRARDDISRLSQQYQAELDALNQTNTELHAETARYQQQYLELQHEFKLQLERVTAELQQQIDAAQTIADEKAEALTALQLDAEWQQTIAAEQFNQLQQHSAEEYQALLQQHYADADQHTAELHTVQEELSAAYRYVERHQHEIAKLSSERELLKQELTRLSRSFVDLRADVKESARKNTKLISALQTRHQLRLQQTEQEHQQIRQLLAGELSQANTTLTDLSEQLAQSATAMQSLEEFAGQQAKEAELQISNLSGQLQQTSESIQLLQHTHADKIAKAEAAIHQLTTKLNKSKVQLKLLEVSKNTEICNLTKINESLKIVIEESKSTIEHLSADLTYLITEKNETSEKLNNAVLYTIELQNSLAECMGEVNFYKKIAWVFNKEIEKNKSPFLLKFLRVIRDRFAIASVNENSFEVTANLYYDGLTNDGNKTEYAGIHKMNNSLPVGDVHMLLTNDGVEYINVLYSKLLGRDPDQYGFEFYTGMLRNGFSKSRVLTEFLRSSEFKFKKNNIRGCKSFVIKYKLSNSLLFGWIASAIFDCERDSINYREARKVNWKLSQLEQSIYNRLSTIEEKINGLSFRIENSVGVGSTAQATQDSQKDSVDLIQEDFLIDKRVGRHAKKLAERIIFLKKINNQA